MLAYTYMEHGRFSLIEKPVPELKDPKDALVRVTLGSICTSDLTHQARQCAACCTGYYGGA